MKRLALLLACFAILACITEHPTHAGKQSRSASRIVYVGKITTSGGYGYLPLLDLSEVQSSRSYSYLFRIDWDSGSGSYSEIGTALYNRRRGTLKCFRKGGHNGGYGLTGPSLRRAAVREHLLFRGVSPAIIAKAGAAAMHDGMSDPMDAFKSLTKYGCRQTMLTYHIFRGVQRASRHEQEREDTHGRGDTRREHCLAAILSFNTKARSTTARADAASA